MAFEADLLVIGSGPAGEKGAVQAAYFGKRVILVEKEILPGGTAVHTGTLPSKSFRETAMLMRQGVRPPLGPMQELLDRKDELRAVEVERIRENLDRHSVEVVHGRARLADPHTVEVESRRGTRRITAEFILVATGSEVYRPEEVDFSDPDIDDCESIVQVAEVPRTLTVIGGGVIGSEYASIFAELGTAVTLVDERPRILSWLDAAISVRLQYAFAQRGIRLRLGERWSSIGRENGVIRTALEDGTEIRTGRLLFAAGRVGATEGLGLEHVGVGVDRRRYVKVDAGFRTAVPSVLAAGDVIGAPALASTSMEQGRVAVCRAFGFDYKQEVGDLVPMGIFTIPEVSAVGLTEEAAKAQYGNVVTGWASYARNPRSMMRGDGTGGVKLVFDAASRRLVGAHHVGDHSAELIHIGLSMITLGGTVDSIIATVFGYPTLAESYKYAAYDALGKLDAAFESPVSPVVPDA